MAFGDKFIVIGGAGFIGSNLVAYLCDLGAEVIVFDDLSTGFDELIDSRCRFYHCSMRDLGGFRQVLVGASAVFILAARSIISTSFTNPLSYMESNISELGNGLIEITRADIPQVIFSSSASVYGVCNDENIKESRVKLPITMYGATKSAGEEILSGFFGAYGLNSVALRYFNAYGPNDLQLPVTRAVPSWIRAGIAGRPVSVFWGGRQVRDYVYVEDIVKAHVACIGLSGHLRFNVGSGGGIAMNDILAHIERALEAPLEVVDAGARLGDPMRLVASCDLIMETTNWRPIWSIQDGIARTVEFYRRRSGR